MKKISVLLFALTISIAAFAQIEAPVKWAYKAKRLGPNEAVILMKANIQPGWHIYSQTLKPGGPIKTSFKFAPSKHYALIGTPIEPTPKIKYEKDFKMNVGYFVKEVVFQQKIKTKTTSPIDVKGSLEYAVCNSIKCLPPEELAFNIPLNKKL